MFHPQLKTISKFLDNWLSKSQAEKITRHINQCEKCKEKVDLLKTVETIVTLQQNADETVADAITKHLPEIKHSTQPLAGVIQGIIGTLVVYKAHDKAEEEGFIGMGLKQGDTVKLLDKSMALIELEDGSSLWLNRSTEINFKSGKQKLGLKAGEIFAIMKPQKEPFVIKTPSAILSVIGTDFNAKLKDNQKTVLSVLKGKVSFQNNTGKTIVTKRRQVEAGKNSKLIPVKISNPESIYRWTSSVKVSKKKGKMSLKSLSLISLIIALLLLGSLLVKGRHQGNERSSVSSESLFDKNAPLSMSSPYHEKGLSWKTTIDKKKMNKETGEYEDYLEIVTRTDILGIDSKGETQTLLTVEHITVKIDNPDQKYVQVAADMRGRQFTYFISQEGNIHSIENYDGKTLTIDEVRVFCFSLLDSNINFLFSGKALTPGDSWNNQFQVNIPGLPGSYISIHNKMRFKDYRNSNGKWNAVLGMEYSGSIGGGIPMSKKVRNNATQTMFMDKLNIGGIAEYVIDVQSGRVVSGTSTDYEKDMKGRIEFQAPDHTTTQKSIERNIDNKFSNTITCGYISQE